jgi:predicted transcriptional regulator
MHLLTNHARLLICIARMPGGRLHELAGAVGLTERATHRIVDELVEAGYITRHRMGKRSFYEVHPDTPLQDGELPPAGAPAIISTVGDLLAVALRRS